MDFSSFLPTLFAAVISAAGTGFGVYVGMSNKIAILETKMDLLVDQAKSSAALEPRVSKLEAEMGLLREQHNARGC